MERIPILKLGPFLLVTIQVELHDALATQLQNDLTDRVARTGARGVLIDVSAIEMVDSFMARTLGQIGSISRVLDADTVLVGVQPQVAITMVEIGLSLGGVLTALDVDRGMALLERRLAERQVGVAREVEPPRVGR